MALQNFFRKRLGMSVLTGILTTLCSGLGLITSALSLASILGQEVEEEVLSYHIERSQLMVQKAYRAAYNDKIKFNQHLLQHIQAETRYDKSFQNMTLIAYPLIYRGGFNKQGMLNKKQSTEVLRSFREAEVSAFELGKLWSEVRESDARSYDDRIKPLQQHDAFHWLTNFTIRFQYISIPIALPNGTTVIAHFTFSLEDLQKKLQKKSRLIWFILGIQTLIISLFALWLSHKHLAKPLGLLAELTHDQFDLKAPIPPPPLDNAPLELMYFQQNFLAMLARLKQENHALAQAHLALTHREGLATAGIISASIMHEIGNPLASVLGLIEFIQNHPHKASEHPQLLDTVYQELKRIQQIKQKLLDLAKPKSYSVHPLKLLEVVQWAQDMLRYQNIAEHIYIATYELDGVEVIADQESLKHVLLNICINAAHALKGSGQILIYAEGNQPYPYHLKQSLSIHQQAMNQSEHLGVIIHIMDHGPGVSDQDKQYIFDLFMSSKEEQGNGLGLPIASLMIEECGGVLWLNDQQEHIAERIHQPLFKQGACFSIWLPHASY